LAVFARQSMCCCIEHDNEHVQVGVKEAKLRAKQAQEMEVLQGRGARGRDQLKRAHAQVLCFRMSGHNRRPMHPNHTACYILVAWHCAFAFILVTSYGSTHEMQQAQGLS